MVDLALGNTAICLGQVPQQQEDRLEEALLDTGDVLRRMRLHRAPQSAVKLVAEKQANHQADRATEHEAQQARDHFAVKHTAPAASSCGRPA